MVLQQTMKAEEHPLALRDLAEPTPGAGEVRVAVRCCGLCHTDLHTVEGDLQLPKLPVTPGHQVVGVVNAVGVGVKSVREGDRVGVPWLYSTCGVCEYCRSGRENLCNGATFTGLHADGGYAEQMIVHEDFCVPLPSRFDDVSAAPLLCAGIVGYRAFRLSGARRGNRIGLYGFGASAHIVIQLARHIGCEVQVMTRAISHRNLARELGAAWVGDAAEAAPAQLDAAIIFAPAGGLVPLALRALKKGATCALAGITMTDLPAMPYDTIYGERVLRSVANATRSDAREFMELAAEVPVRTQVETFALKDANEALVALKHSRLRGAGVLVTAG